MKIEVGAASSNRPERSFTGLAVSPGIAVGRAYLSEAGTLPTPEYDIPPAGVAAEQERFTEAVATAVKQVRKLKSKAAQHGDGVAGELCELFDAWLQMLSGSRLVRGVERLIAERRVNAEAAVRSEIAAIVEGFHRMGDSYLAGRADDIREVGDRLIRNLLKTPYQAYQGLPVGSILIAEELSPADAALLDPTRIAGFATILGGAESHTAIMARSLGIPAVFGVTGLASGIEHGDIVVVDGGEGRVVVNPQPKTAELYAARAQDLAEERTRLARLKPLPAVTRDGMPIALLANVEMAREIDDAHEYGAMGVGLLRTEFMFMNRETAPSEEEQTGILSEIVARMKGRTVTIRTLDIGGDKLAPSLREQVGEPAEPGANPALGVRGVRLSLAHERLFETQLAAILRASTEGPIRILLPMITSVEEIRAVQIVLDRVAKRLRRRHAKVGDAMPPLGVMIEVPGAALSADSLAAEADFFAIGTNDLTMYTLAIDRGDERVAPLYNPLHPAVLRLIQFAVEAGLRARIPVSVCGEIAGDPRFTALLLGLGVRELSMATRSLLRVKQRVRAINLVEAARRARAVMDQGDSRAIAALLDDFNAGCAALETGE